MRNNGYIDEVLGLIALMRYVHDARFAHIVHDARSALCIACRHDQALCAEAEKVTVTQYDLTLLFEVLQEPLKIC